MISWNWDVLVKRKIRSRALQCSGLHASAGTEVGCRRCCVYVCWQFHCSSTGGVCVQRRNGHVLRLRTNRQRQNSRSLRYVTLYTRPPDLTHPPCFRPLPKCLHRV